MSDPEKRHVPVMVEEVVNCVGSLSGVFLDCTVGEGGHTEAILGSFERCRVVGLDVDVDALELAKRRLAKYGSRVILKHASYTEAEKVLQSLAISHVDGILLDLGVSTLQLEKSERGFAFARNGPLDMRMNTDQDLTAFDIVNTWPESRIARILFEYGEEKRFSKRIARVIVANRPIVSTKELVAAISKALPYEVKRSRRRHFATKVFQAIRIAVNDELNNVRRVLEVAPNILAKSGRILVISFHSLEDRIVKQAFRSCEQLRVITRKPMLPSSEEVVRNPRSRSAKLRVAERI
ncbi:MAG: 16S rRNA (cytosine(1402)-N(4))-methyltransferase [Thermotogae bacterium]|nr:MAG: 16S rRNA (cytosine(1402)-N(4))-methyltransferase [Thermotogota bacterium]